jgi:hypothetical protein
MIMQSFYLCTTQAQIAELVQRQPTPALFFKSFLEFDTIPMASILAFDTRSIRKILDESNEEHFSTELYPIFYKNQIPKKTGKGYYYRNALDNALRNNQAGALTAIIEYIIKYQNSHVSAPLFKGKLETLLSKGIGLAPLFASNVFNYTFDFDEWPSAHHNGEDCSHPYLGSVFELRNKYPVVFPSKEFAEVDYSEEKN